MGNTTARWALSATTGSFAGALSGVTTAAVGNTTITGFLSLSNRITQTGTVTDSGGYISLSGQINSTQTGQQNMFTMQSQVSPQGAGTLAALYGLLFLPTIVSSANNITNLNGVFARADSLVSYTGSINAIYTFSAGTPTWGSATLPSNVFQYTAFNATAISNVYGFWSQITAGANKWGFYASGTANNYMNGSLGIGTTDLNAKLTVLGTANVSTSVNSALITVGTSFIANTTGAFHTTRLSAGLGATGTPSHTFTGDTDTGMWSPAADTIAFSEGGTEVMRITSSGNVGIGDTSPAYKLTLAGDMRLTGGGDIRIGSATGTTTSGGDSTLYSDSNDLIFTTGTTTTERFRIGSVGQLGIGGANYGTAGQVLRSGGSGAAPTWATHGIRSSGQNVIDATKTLGAADSGTNILITTSGITITFPSTGFASGEGFVISNVSGNNVTLAFPGGSDIGTTLPHHGSFFAFCDGGGFWRQYCYSTSRL